jgi:hypothetical protein
MNPGSLSNSASLTNRPDTEAHVDFAPCIERHYVLKETRHLRPML